MMRTRVSVKAKCTYFQDKDGETWQWGENEGKVKRPNFEPNNSRGVRNEEPNMARNHTASLSFARRITGVAIYKNILFIHTILCERENHGAERKHVFMKKNRKELQSNI